MKWPRGKYNGRRIVGFVLKIKLDVCCWSLTIPRGGSCLGLGPLRIWVEPNYKFHED